MKLYTLTLFCCVNSSWPLLPNRVWKKKWLVWFYGIACVCACVCLICSFKLSVGSMRMVLIKWVLPVAPSQVIICWILLKLPIWSCQLSLFWDYKLQILLLPPFLSLHFFWWLEINAYNVDRALVFQQKSPCWWPNLTKFRFRTPRPIWNCKMAYTGQPIHRDIIVSRNSVNPKV